MSVIKAEKREKAGSAEARRVRAKGYIPAIIYLKDGNVNLSVNGREFEKEYFKNNIFTSVIELDLDGKKTKVIAHKVDTDPVTDRPSHIDFLSCDKGSEVIAKPRLIFTNKDKSPGIKKGGVLHINLRRVEVKCTKEVPQTIEVSVSGLHLGAKIRCDSLDLPQGVSLTKKSDALIASIIGRGKSDTDTPESSADGQATAVSGEQKAPAGGEAKKEDK